MGLRSLTRFWDTRAAIHALFLSSLAALMTSTMLHVSQWEMKDWSFPIMVGVSTQFPPSNHHPPSTPVSPLPRPANPHPQAYVYAKNAEFGPAPKENKTKKTKCKSIF